MEWPFCQFENTCQSVCMCFNAQSTAHISANYKKNQYRFRKKRGHSANCIKKIYLTEHLGLKAHFLSVYRVDQQCCPGRNHRGGSPDFLAKSLVIPTKYTKFKLITHKFKLELHIYGDFRRDNIDGPHGTQLTFTKIFENIFVAFCHRLWWTSYC